MFLLNPLTLFFGSLEFGHHAIPVKVGISLLLFPIMGQGLFQLVFYLAG